MQSAKNESFDASEIHLFSRRLHPDNLIEGLTAALSNLAINRVHVHCDVFNSPGAGRNLAIIASTMLVDVTDYEPSSKVPPPIYRPVYIGYCRKGVDDFFQRLSTAGVAVDRVLKYWQSLPEHRRGVQPDFFQKVEFRNCLGGIGFYASPNMEKTAFLSLFVYSVIALKKKIKGFNWLNAIDLLCTVVTAVEALQMYIVTQGWVEDGDVPKGNFLARSYYETCLELFSRWNGGPFQRFQPCWHQAMSNRDHYRNVQLVKHIVLRMNAMDKTHPLCNMGHLCDLITCGWRGCPALDDTDAVPNPGFESILDVTNESFKKCSKKGNGVRGAGSFVSMHLAGALVLSGIIKHPHLLTQAHIATTTKTAESLQRFFGIDKSKFPKFLKTLSLALDVSEFVAENVLCEFFRDNKTSLSTDSSKPHHHGKRGRTEPTRKKSASSSTNHAGPPTKFRDCFVPGQPVYVVRPRTFIESGEPPSGKCHHTEYVVVEILPSGTVQETANCWFYPNGTPNITKGKVWRLYEPLPVLKKARAFRDGHHVFDEWFQHEVPVSQKEQLPKDTVVAEKKYVNLDSTPSLARALFLSVSDYSTKEVRLFHVRKFAEETIKNEVLSDGKGKKKKRSLTIGKADSNSPQPRDAETPFSQVKRKLIDKLSTPLGSEWPRYRLSSWSGRSKWVAPKIKVGDIFSAPKVIGDDQIAAYMGVVFTTDDPHAPVNDAIEEMKKNGVPLVLHDLFSKEPKDDNRQSSCKHPRTVAEAYQLRKRRHTDVSPVQLFWEDEKSEQTFDVAFDLDQALHAIHRCKFQFEDVVIRCRIEKRMKTLHSYVPILSSDGEQSMTYGIDLQRLPKFPLLPDPLWMHPFDYARNDIAAAIPTAPALMAIDLTRMYPSSVSLGGLEERKTCRTDEKSKLSAAYLSPEMALLGEQLNVLFRFDGTTCSKEGNPAEAPGERVRKYFVRKITRFLKKAKVKNPPDPIHARFIPRRLLGGGRYGLIATYTGPFLLVTCSSSNANTDVTIRMICPDPDNSSDGGQRVCHRVYKFLE